VTLTATSTNATTCTFSVTPAIAGLPVSLSCSSGTTMTTVNVPANPGSTARTLTFKVVAKQGKKSATATGTVTQAAPVGVPVTSFTSSPGVVAHTGGKVILTATVLATSCAFSVSPAVAGLPKKVPCAGTGSVTVKLPANVGSQPVGYTFTVTATSANHGVTSATLLVDVAPVTPLATITVTGDITTSTTWSDLIASTYVIQNFAEVAAGVVLNLNNGTVVKASGSGQICEDGIACAIDTMGTLNATGATFTSINDNSVGGPTGTGSPAEGDWRGFGVAGTLSLSNTTVDYAAFCQYGTCDSLFGYGGPSITFTNDSFVNSAQLIAQDDTGPITISGTRTSGSITLQGVDAPVLTGDSVTDGNINITCHSVPTIENDVVTNPGGIAYYIESQAIVLDQVTGDTATGTGELAVEFDASVVTGTWSGSLPIVAYRGLTISGTVTLPQGTTVKLGGTGLVCANGVTCSIKVAGTLDATGVTFTSLNDNSVGGVTGSGSPGEGDWLGFGVTGTLDLSNSVVDYADGCTYGLCESLFGYGGASITVTGGTFSNSSQLVVQDGTGPLTVSDTTTDASLNFQTEGSPVITGDSVSDGTITVEDQTTMPTVTDDTVTDPGGMAYFIQSPDIDFDNVTGDSAVGNGTLAIEFDASIATGTWNESLPMVTENTLVLTGTTILTSGSVVKSTSSGQFCQYETACSIDVEGTLDATGVTFTSVNDNSVGGMTGSGSPAEGDWYGFGLEGGTLDLRGSSVDYAATCKYGLCQSLFTNGDDPVTLTDDIFSDSAQLTFDGDPGQITVTGTTADATLSMVGVESPVVTGNTVTSGQIVIYNEINSQITLENNQVIDPLGAAYVISTPYLDLADITGNAASGPDTEIELLQSTLVDSGTWQNPISMVIAGQLLILPSVTLTLSAGTVVKGNYPAGGQPCPDGSLCSFLVEGELDADGVTFTSVNDNSVGGDTGSGTPIEGDWGGFGVAGTGILTVNNTNVDYAGGTTTYYGENAVWGTTDQSITLNGDTFSGSAGVWVNDSSTVAGNFTMENTTLNPGSGGSYGGAFVDYVTNAVLTGDTVEGGGITIVNTVNTTPVLENDSVVAPGDPAYTMQNAILNFGTITNDVASGDNMAGMFLSGGNSAYGEWNNTTLPLVLESTLYVNASDTLTLDPGTMIKVAPNETGIDVPASSDFVVGASGIPATPVIFTSQDDGSVGGVTEAGGTASRPTPFDDSEYGGTGIQLESASAGDTVDGAQFQYLVTAISVPLLAALAVGYSQFSYDEDAVAVESTTQEYPWLGLLPCVPPWEAFVDASTDWWGGYGVPGGDIDVGSIIDFSLGLIPPPFNQLAANVSKIFDVYQTLSGQGINFPLNENRIPWAVYSCLGVSFPITPVNFVAIAPGPVFPHYAEPPS